MKNKNIILVIVFAVVFLVTSVLFKVFGVTDIWFQLTGTLLGTIITAIVTLALLSVQTDKEIGHDRDVGIFEKKQEVYHNFITGLEKITQDGKLNVPCIEGHDNNEEDELQHLIYQLGFVQMLADHDTAEKITNLVGELLGNVSVMRSPQVKKNEAYSHLAKNIFDIVSLLREDLYKKSQKTDRKTFIPVSEEKFKEAIRLSGAFDSELEIDSETKREEELKTFLVLLQEEFKKKGRNSIIYYRDMQPKTENEIAKAAHDYVNVEAYRYILFKFPLNREKKYFQFTFDDYGDYYAEIKDKNLGENANDDTAIKQYRELTPADQYINFLDTNIEGYKRFARLSKNGKKAFVQNMVNGVEEKLAKIFNSEEN